MYLIQIKQVKSHSQAADVSCVCPHRLSSSKSWNGPGWLPLFFLLGSLTWHGIGPIYDPTLRLRFSAA